jgi:hypothetical protein
MSYQLTYINDIRIKKNLNINMTQGGI